MAQAQQEHARLMQLQMNQMRQKDTKQNYGYAAWKAPRYALPIGIEKKAGSKSNLPPKPISFSTDQELFFALYEHYKTGEGQSVEIDFSKLDFSDSLDVKKLLKNQRELLVADLHDDVKARLLSKSLNKKVQVYSNAKVSHILIDDPFTEVELNIPKLSSRYLTFGRLKVNLKNTHIVINKKNYTFTLHTEIVNFKDDEKSRNYLEKYDFHAEAFNGRGYFPELAVRGVQRFAPGSSASFDIHIKPNSASHFKKMYRFSEILN